jgi:hypothetical protein
VTPGWAVLIVGACYFGGWYLVMRWEWLGRGPDRGSL